MKTDIGLPVIPMISLDKMIELIIETELIHYQNTAKKLTENGIDPTEFVKKGIMKLCNKYKDRISTIKEYIDKDHPEYKDWFEKIMVLL